MNPFRKVHVWHNIKSDGKAKFPRGKVVYTERWGGVYNTDIGGIKVCVVRRAWSFYPIKSGA